jgi:hypothetical protein
MTALSTFQDVTKAPYLKKKNQVFFGHTYNIILDEHKIIVIALVS